MVIGTLGKWKTSDFMKGSEELARHQNKLDRAPKFNKDTFRSLAVERAWLRFLKIQRRASGDAATSREGGLSRWPPNAWSRGNRRSRDAGFGHLGGSEPTNRRVRPLMPQRGALRFLKIQRRASGDAADSRRATSAEGSRGEAKSYYI